MHSLLKQETETSKMVEHLAKLQRQYTEWNDDNVTIEKEIEFVKAYLELQKYRFGDRLSFDIDVETECLKLLIPKLTIVTFVENACIHGIESKITPGWIFVRISTDGEFMTLEIEDTGNGMEEEEAKSLLRRMRFANIEMLKEKGRVGIVNACLRLKMMSEDEATFDLDSEPGTGTLVQIMVPVKYLKGLL
jgi:two-component system sensor histidine kinase YesM